MRRGASATANVFATVLGINDYLECTYQAPPAFTMEGVRFV
ncbi:MAG: hypothetical protein V1792_09020 [Pseudomonadota bacterium]